MTTRLKTNASVTAIAVIALSALCAPDASACGSSVQRMAPSRLATMPLVLAMEPVAGSVPFGPPQPEADSPMTGLWKTVFVSGGSVVIFGFDTWHSDGTELALDSFAPSSGQVCPGVWQRIGPRTYATVHPAFNYDSAGQNVVSIFIERLKVVLSADGASFQGTFNWDNYDFQGHLLSGSVAGTVTGSRVAVGAPFPFPFPQ